jgi:hypothetical protein
MIYPEPEAKDKIYQYPLTHVKTRSTFTLASMNYFDSDISKSTHTVVYFDWKMVFIFTFAKYVAHNFINAAKFELTIIHQDVNLRRESRSHGHVLMRL